LATRVSAGHPWPTSALGAAASLPWLALSYSLPFSIMVAARRGGTEGDKRPEAHSGSGTIALHRCPFAEVAREDRAVVCSTHLSMLRDMVEQLDVPLNVGLEPVRVNGPEYCLVRLERALRQGGQRVGRSGS
jgi:hypothetical protein